MTLEENLKRTNYWKPIIKAFKDSGESYQKFAQKNNLVKHQLAYWNLKLGRQALKVLPKSNFIKVVTPEVDTYTKLPDPKWVARVMEELYHAFNRYI